MTGHDEKSGTSDTIIPLAGTHVMDAEGHIAQIISMRQDDAEAKAIIHIDGGREMVLPMTLLSAHSNGMHRLPFAFRNLSSNENGDRIVIPLWREEAKVDKRVIDTGKGVRIHKTVSEIESTIDEPLISEELSVERRPVGRRVDANDPPTARREGETLVVPVLEEKLIVEKQLWLTEEVRVTTHRHQVHRPQTVMLRSEQAAVERFDEGGSSTSASRTNQSDSPSRNK